MKARRSTALRTLVLATAAVAASLGLFECGLRVAGISYPSFYQRDAHTGTALRPGAEGMSRGEGGAFVRINRQGRRDEERAFEKPADVVRVAVLGDSFALARQVPLEQTFGSVLERLLPDCPGLSGRRVEVLNFGVSGYGTAQELQTLRHRVWPYDPDLVLLAVTTGNDLRDNSRALSGVANRPYFRLEGSELVLDTSFRDLPSHRVRSSPLARAAYFMIHHSRVVQVINEALNVRKRRSWMRQRSTPGRLEGFAYGLDHEIYAPPRTAEWSEAWRVTEALIARMDEEVRERGARLLVVTLSNPIQVHPDPETRARFRAALGVADLFYPDRRIEALGERKGFPVLNLAPILQRAAEPRGLYVHGFENTELGAGHWNATGHALAGEQIARFACDAFSPRDPAAN
ncbi:MAG: SGNH/GDSL hydrolase family protein [Deltaproteobacteria bacterium]|nr:MAG: SGNH/GDSL hydrolase family protein [Deltaproteobacteria bacterium]